MTPFYITLEFITIRIRRVCRFSNSQR